MRIALVHYSAPPVIGGVERVMAQQAEVIARHGHQVVVVCANKGAKVSGAIMEYAPNFYVKRVMSALAGAQVVMVHNMFTMPFNWEASQMIAGLSREMTGTRFINWVHDMDVSREAFTALNLKASHVAVSEVRRGEFCKVTGLKPKDCRVVPNGIDSIATLGLTAPVAAFARKHRLLGRDIVLFHPARLLARKNVEFTVEVVAALQKRGTNAACVITGAADLYRPESLDYAAAIRGLISRKKMQAHVLLASDAFAVGEDDVRSLYSVADGLFFPSKAEGFGLPLLEAPLHRVPVICSDIPSHRELAVEGASFFSLAEKPDEVAARIAAHFKKDKSTLRRREVLAKYDWERVYKEWLEPLLNER
jgi:glycosyltransferase involved in cell wall biosynthesis